MANNCYSQFTFYVPVGDREKLESFYKFFIDNIKLGRITNFFKKLDMTPEYYEAKTENLNNEILSCGNIEEVDKDGKRICCFTVDTESAWRPCPEHFKMLIDYEWQGIKFDFYAEEVDCGLFINTDKDGVFNPTRYRVYGYYYSMNKDGGNEFEEYFENKAELVKFLNDELETDKFKEEMDISYMETIAEEILDPKFETYSVSIYEFETEL